MVDKKTPDFVMTDADLDGGEPFVIALRGKTHKLPAASKLIDLGTLIDLGEDDPFAILGVMLAHPEVEEDARNAVRGIPALKATKLLEAWLEADGLSLGESKPSES